MLNIGENIMLVDKPVGFSSFQMVRLLQKTGRKVGHTGTLDPFASGLVIMMFGQTTREFRNFEIFEKEYTGEIILGIATDSYDITGHIITQVGRLPDIHIEDVQEMANRFVGEIDQVPPVYSALKIQGRRSYALSRQGRKVNLAPRKVLVKKLDIIEVASRKIKFNAVVGKGVYIRSLANDLGVNLGCGGTLLSLRRIRIGDNHVRDAFSLGSLLGDQLK